MAESLFAGGALWPCQSSHSSSWERGGTDVTFCPTPTLPSRSWMTILHVDWRTVRSTRCVASGIGGAGG